MSAVQSSLWYAGTVDVSMPVPMPHTYRPTIIIGTLIAAVWRTAPTMMKTMATHMLLRRPRRSHMINVKMQPEKQPRL
jgi:hypothetical protein